MALELKLAKNSVTENGDRMFIGDVTGAYDAQDNDTGYGAPNEERANLGLFLFVDKKETTGDTAMVLQPSDPETVDEWEVTLTGDAWYQCNVYGLIRYDVAIEAFVDELTYDYVADEIRKILTKTGSGPWVYTYEVVSSDVIEDEANTKRYTTLFDTNDLTQLCKCWTKSLRAYFSNPSRTEADKARYEEIDGSLKSIRTDFGFDQSSTAQQQVESLTEVCECFSQDPCETC